jgi:hypothetical protein
MRPPKILRTTEGTAPEACQGRAAVAQTYPQLDSRSDLPHTRCTDGSSSGRPDRGGGMYPLRVNVTMSIHKLTAGAGYDYLTRQVAASDATEKGHIGLAAYYTGRGEKPGL